MAKRAATPLEAGIVTRKGEAAPITGEKQRPQGMTIRLPREMNEALRVAAFEARVTKQDLIIGWIEAGLKKRG